MNLMSDNHQSLLLKPHLNLLIFLLLHHHKKSIHSHQLQSIVAMNEPEFYCLVRTLDFLSLKAILELLQSKGQCCCP